MEDLFLSSLFLHSYDFQKNKSFKKWLVCLSEKLKSKIFIVLCINITYNNQNYQKSTCIFIQVTKPSLKTQNRILKQTRFLMHFKDKHVTSQCLVSPPKQPPWAFLKSYICQEKYKIGRKPYLSEKSNSAQKQTRILRSFRKI